jgi:hypothetical protein
MGGRTYERGGIGAVEAEESDRRLDALGSSGGGECPGLVNGNPLGGRGPHGAKQCLSRQHG